MPALPEGTIQRPKPCGMPRGHLPPLHRHHQDHQQQLPLEGSRPVTPERAARDGAKVVIKPSMIPYQPKPLPVMPATPEEAFVKTPPKSHKDCICILVLCTCDVRQTYMYKIVCEAVYLYIDVHPGRRQKRSQRKIW